MFYNGFVYDLFCSGSEAVSAFRRPLERSCTSNLIGSHKGLKVAKNLSYQVGQNKLYALLAVVLSLIVVFTIS
jgi:hypothetical protein